MGGAAPELVVELRGRLGNQLFLWASGVGIARAAGAELRFWNRVPADELLIGDVVTAPLTPVDPRRLWEFGFVARPPRPEMLWRHAARRYGKVRRRLGNGAAIVDCGPHGRYHSELTTITGPTLVRDYLQSERYFAAVADEIDRAITFPDRSTGLPSAIPRPAVAMSFRRGDYNVLGAALPLGYYERALDALTARVDVSGGTVVLFSDDAAFSDLAARWLRQRGLAALDAWSVSPDTVDQLRMLSECDHFVTANSTYSWWGAWLGERRRTHPVVVVSPEEYRGGGDRVPDRWLTVPGGYVADAV